MGVLLVLSGPSGAGKGTIAAAVLRRCPGAWLSISATTRPPRPGEEDGVDYVFVSRDAFEKSQANGDFLEAFEVFGHLYGTPRRALLEHLAAGADVICEIDVQGAMAVREAFPDSVLVFLRPPSRQAQRDRLEGRAGDDGGTIERRLAAADAEEEMAGLFDAVVVNDDVETAVASVAGILEARRGWGEPPRSPATPSEPER